MAKTTAALLPSTHKLLDHFGNRLRLARLRRQLTAKQVAERAGMSVMTLRGLERGGSGVTMGAYLSVMQVLGIESDLDLLGKADPSGRELQDALLPGRSTKSRKPRQVQSMLPPTISRDTTKPIDRPHGSSKPGGRASAQRKAPHDWVDEGQFVDAKSLADLIAPATLSTPSKKRGR